MDNLSIGNNASRSLDIERYSNTPQSESKTLSSSKAQSDSVEISAESFFAYESELAYEVEHFGNIWPEEDERKADELNKQIDKILGTEDIKMSDKDDKAVEALYLKMDEIFKDGEVSAQEEKQLNKLDEELASIYGKYEKPLTEEEEQKLNKLFDDLDALYEKNGEFMFDEFFDSESENDENVGQEQTSPILPALSEDEAAFLNEIHDKIAKEGPDKKTLDLLASRVQEILDKNKQQS